MIYFSYYSFRHSDAHTETCFVINSFLKNFIIALNNSCFSVDSFWASPKNHRKAASDAEIIRNWLFTTLKHHIVDYKKDFITQSMTSLLQSLHGCSKIDIIWTSKSSTHRIYLKKVFWGFKFAFFLCHELFHCFHEHGSARIEIFC